MATEDPREIGGFSLVNVEAIDLERWPSFADVPWTRATIRAGDCIYLPWGYLHQVRSRADETGRNLAVSMLFGVHVDPTSKEGRACQEEATNITLDQADVFWTYDGHGEMSMGNADPELIRGGILRWIRKAEQENRRLDVSAFVDAYAEEADRELEEVAKEAEVMFQALVEDDEQELSAEAVSRAPARIFKELPKALLSLDVANTEDYEIALLGPEQLVCVLWE